MKGDWAFDMFPETERVVYARNPLDEVTCELRFPPILKISGESPIAFQEQVRKNYPMYKKHNDLEIPKNLPQEIAHLIAADFALGKQPIHDFSSRDDLWTIRLSNDLLAMNCNQYERWEKFRSEFYTAYTAFSESYHPSYFQRVSLRYKNLILRSRLDLVDEPWIKLINPQVCGWLGDSNIADSVASIKTTALLKLPDHRGIVKVQAYLAHFQPVNEIVFVIDLEVATDNQTETNHVLDLLDKFHTDARTIFRYCITDTLHTSLQPTPC